MSSELEKMSVGFDEEFRRYSGLEELREAQREVLESLDRGLDTISILATNGGKSWIIWLWALMNEGLTLVVEPTNTVTFNHVEKLQAALDVTKDLREGENVTVRSLTYENTLDERRQIAEEIRKGVCKILYISPERLKQDRFVEFVNKLTLDQGKPVRIAIDEAHSLFYDRLFRPAYLMLRYFLNQYDRHVGENLQTASFTATLPEEAFDFLVSRLQLDPEKMAFHSRGLERDDLACDVKKCSSEQERYEDLVGNLREHCENDELAVVFCSSVAEAKKLTKRLNGDLGGGVEGYHGQLKLEERRAMIGRFEKHQMNVLVVTKAFGPGVDIKDIRGGYAYNVAGSLVECFQRMGRLSRDQEGGFYRIYFMEEDFKTYQYFLKKMMKRISVDFIMEVYDAVDKNIKMNPVERGMVEDKIYNFDRFSFYKHFRDQCDDEAEGYELERLVDTVLNFFLEHDVVDILDGAVWFDERPKDKLAYEIAGMIKKCIKTELAIIDKYRSFLAEQFEEQDVLNQSPEIDEEGRVIPRVYREIGLTQKEIIRAMHRALPLDKFWEIDELPLASLIG